MAFKRNSIGDDWEDVADDNLSVISLPMSEGKDHVAGPTTPTLQGTGLADITIKDTVTLRLPIEAATQYGGKDDGQPIVTGSKPEDGHGHALKTPPVIEGGSASSDAFRCLHFDHTGCEDDAMARSENATPDDFLRNHKSLSKVLDDTIHAINDLTTLHSGIADETLAVCLSLATQVAELEPMLVVYARVCLSTSTEIPLDPGLFTWLSGVQVNALALRSELQDEVERTAQRTGSTPCMSPSLRGLLDALKNHEQQMEAFLPIIQVDFNEFQTCRMNIPTPQLDHAHGATVTYTSSPTRSATYRLRDEIQRASKCLSQASQCPLAAPASVLAAAMAQQYSRLFAAISTMLSNHGSEWIDHALAGGMTHMEFVQLDAVEVSEYADSLRQAVDDLDGLRLHWRETCTRATGADEGRQAMFQTHGSCTLQQLDVLMQVLSATFRVTIE